MGTREPDRCIFCNEDLEEWSYEYFVENGSRANSDEYEEKFFSKMNICKGCIGKLKFLINDTVEKEGEQNGS